MTQTMSVKIETNEGKKGCESIHSGQFMVSHFEAEDTQEDDEDGLEMQEESDDNAINRSNPKPTSTLLYKSKLSTNPLPSTSANNLQLVRYQSIATDHQNPRAITQVEIDSDLSQVFNTLNVTYKQKLTSPKWNPFKGIRLRWKEKIRLNNVIWRCWHMQFIMKKRPLVCQFASPLDVDVHNTPQAIILEGKYWKRKCKVITAEYKKWRRFNVNKEKESSLILSDTRSEVDTLEWTQNDNIFMLSDNMSSDTLFSTISQFPFPDSREIARGAGRADFIQPSLGPLQPNFEDFMDFELDIFNNFNVTNRLAPVPEEQTEEILKAIENFPIIESMDSANMQDTIVSSTSQTSNIPNSMNQMGMDPQNNNPLHFTATIFAQDVSGLSPQANNNANNNNILNMTPQQARQQAPHIQHIGMSSNVDPFMSGQLQIPQQMQQQQQIQPQSISVQPDDKDNFKSKISRYPKLPKREPHNYDKCQPTTHQTLMYNQMLAQQETQQTFPDSYGNMTDMTNMSGGSQMQAANNFNTQQSAITQAGQNVLNLSSSNQQQLQEIATKMMVSFQQQQQPLTPQQAQFFQMHSHSLPLNLNPQQLAQQQISLGHISNSNQDIYKSPQSPSYKSYHGIGQQPYKIPTQHAGNYNRQMRQPSPPHPQAVKVLQQQQQQQQQPSAKEMYRSNSLPINSTISTMQFQNIQKEEPFAVPRYHATKTQRTSPSQQPCRSRSNSMVIKQGQTFPPLQAAASEPMLNANSALLAQLLTSNQNSLMGKSPLQQQQRTVSSSATNSPLVQTPQTSNASSIQLSKQSQNQMATPSTSALSSSSSQSSSSSNYLYSANTPTLSPDSAIDHDLPLSPDRASNSKFQSRTDRRTGHIHAEQKRRYNIKNGFDLLHSLIPQLQQNPNAKLSKASMLQKGAEYIKQLRMERSAVQEQMEALRKEMDTLNNSLNHLHTALPANGVPMSRQGNVREMYNDYVLQKTKSNWKFWIFGLIFEPLMNSYNSTVSVASMEELCRTAQLWVDNSCSLVEIRPAVSNKLRELSTTTDILSDNPTTLQEEVMRIVAAKSNSKKQNKNQQKEGPS